MRLEDNAVYQCEATNIHGKAWANFYLNLLTFMPFAEEQPGTVEAVIGDSAKVRCKFFGSPTPAVRWWHKKKGDEDYKEIIQNGDYEFVKDDKGFDVLLIRRVENHMSGEYRCDGKNKVGEATATGNLLVLGKNKTTVFWITRKN